MGVWTRQTDVSGDRVLVHREQATGGPGSATLADVVEDLHDLVRWESSIFEWCALSFGEGLLAGSAVDHANPLTAARPAAKIQVPATACTVIGARVIPATEVFDRVHSGFFRRSNFRPGRYLRSVSHTRHRLPATVCSPKTPPRNPWIVQFSHRDRARYEPGNAQTQTTSASHTSANA